MIILSRPPTWPPCHVVKPRIAQKNQKIVIPPYQNSCLALRPEGLNKRNFIEVQGLINFFFLLFFKASKLSILLRRFSPSNHVAYATCTSPIMQLISPSSPTPKILHKHCFQFLLGRLSYPGEIKNICGRFFFGGGGGGVQIRCIMGNVKVANRLPYPGHTTVFVPRACRFFSAEWLWQRCLAGKDV